MTDRLSIRERELLETISRFDSIGLSSLAHVGCSLPEDELRVVIGSLQARRLVAVFPGHRTEILSLTSLGREAARG